MNNKEAKIFAVELGVQMPELDLHGFYVEEALSKLESFLYKSYQEKTAMARVIYGFGTGKLGEEVLAYLKKHPLVGEAVEGVGSCVVIF